MKLRKLQDQGWEVLSFFLSLNFKIFNQYTRYVLIVSNETLIYDDLKRTYDVYDNYMELRCNYEKRLTNGEIFYLCTFYLKNKKRCTELTISDFPAHIA